jgi:hypothetical protein
MLSPVKFRAVQDMRVKRERSAAAALRRAENTVIETHARQSENARVIAEIEHAKLKVYADIPESITRSDLYQLKRSESMLEHQLIEQTIAARALAEQLQTAIDAQRQAQERLVQTHRRVVKIDHAHKQCAAGWRNNALAQEENEMDDTFLEN